MRLGFWTRLKVWCKRVFRLAGLASGVSTTGAEPELQFLDAFSQKPWTDEENPHLSNWLSGNEKPLDAIATATGRSHYYLPILRVREGTCAGVLLPEVVALREIGWAFAAHAMLQLGRGNSPSAWQDLLVCHRLGRLVGRGGTLFESLIANVIEQTACNGEVVFLAHQQPDSKSIDSCIRDLRALPPPASLADKIDLGERYIGLDSIMQFDRRGLSLLSQAWDIEEWQVAEQGFTEEVLKDIDWDPALKAINTWYDRMVAALRQDDRNARNRELADIREEVINLKSRFDQQLWDALQTENVSPALRGEVVGYWGLKHSLPEFDKVIVAEDRIRQINKNVLVALWLARYRVDNGRFPDTLASLVPGYCQEVPKDLFTGNPLIYKPTANGYLLYSVGPNGIDDGGRGQVDSPPGDDIAVRMPSR
jgi:hypothetical protein